MPLRTVSCRPPSAMRAGRAAGRARRAASLVTGLLALAGLTPLLSCGGDDLASPFVERRIGPEGGVVESADGNALVRIPPGALAETVPIRVRRLDPDEIPDLLARQRRVSDSYLFQPDELVFEIPVRVEIYFDAETLPSGVALEDLTLGKVNILALTDELEKLSDVEIIVPDASAAALQVVRRGLGGQASSFSAFGVWVEDAEEQP